MIHVLDASRSVTVVGSLLGEDKEEYVQDILDEYEEVSSDEMEMMLWGLWYGGDALQVRIPAHTN